MTIGVLAAITFGMWESMRTLRRWNSGGRPIMFAALLRPYSILEFAIFGGLGVIIYIALSPLSPVMFAAFIVAATTAFLKILIGASVRQATSG